MRRSRILNNITFIKQMNKCSLFVLPFVLHFVLPLRTLFLVSWMMLVGFSKEAFSKEAFSKEGRGSSFYDLKAEGWHWYEEKKHEEKSYEEKKNQKTPYESPKPLTPTEEVEALKEKLNHLLNKAILYPTSENVLTYKRHQEAFMEKSHEFARVWQRVTFENPDLDYSLKFPTQHTGRLIYKEEEGRRKDKVLRDLAKEYGLFYIFKSDCRYCTAFAPVVKGFSKKYGWDVLAISQDGIRNEEFSNAQVNNGMIENLQIDTFPALLAVHPETGRVIPLAYGLTSLSDIETRAYSLGESPSQKIIEENNDHNTGENTRENTRKNKGENQ